jgi:hypothetical protein
MWAAMWLIAYSCGIQTALHNLSRRRMMVAIFNVTLLLAHLFPAAAVAFSYSSGL